MSDFPIKPIGDRVVVKFFEEGEDTTASGLVLSVGGKSKYKYGRIVATGRGTVVDGTLLEPEVKKGDLVQAMNRAGDEVKVGEETYHLISERHILAVLDEKEATPRIIKGQLLSESK